LQANFNEGKRSAPRHPELSMKRTSPMMHVASAIDPKRTELGPE